MKRGVERHFRSQGAWRTTFAWRDSAAAAPTQSGSAIRFADLLSSSLPNIFVLDHISIRTAGRLPRRLR